MQRVPLQRATVCLAFAYAALFTIVGGWQSLSSASEATSPHAAPQADYVGSERCSACHRDEAGSWRASQHAVAMQEASDISVLGHFDGAVVAKPGSETRFFRRAGRVLVSTDGPDGNTSEFEIRFTFGVYPLQQYLLSLPGGRLQAFAIAWDARPASEGGQRWFDLYPHEQLAAGDALHWTGREQTWNHQCAACHSTNVRKNYDGATDTYATTWSEIGVGCEACHGPGRNHLAWAATHDARDPLKGFAAPVSERAGITWTKDATGQGRRSAPRTTSHEIEMCAKCHSRREQISEAAGTQLFDAFRPVRIAPDLYWPDGQQRDEVFTYGSFLQSRMHAEGVTCSDCHDPHSGKLRASGNGLCTQCHAASRWDATTHHHHAAGSAGSACVSCHMPTTVYMGIDARHDHSFRRPRPDLTQSLGVPNACQRCHEGKPAAALAEALTAWGPHARSGLPSFAEAFDLADRGAPDDQALLKTLIGDPSQPAIVRASAISRLTFAPSSIPLIRRSLEDTDPGVRMAALEVLRYADPATKLDLVPQHLADRSRAVRIEAARVLAGPAEARLDGESRVSFEAALAEYVAAATLNWDRPETNVDLASLHLARGRAREAEGALDSALKIAPSFSPAYVLLGEIARARGDEASAESILRKGLDATPTSPDLLHALGLSLVRQHRISDALEFLLRAARSTPSTPRYAYIAAVALHDSERRNEAIALLEQMLAAHPYNQDLRALLVAYESEQRSQMKKAP